MPESLREQLAALCHEQWSGWMAYLFSRLTTGGMDQYLPRASVIEVPDYDRWTRQMRTPYTELPEHEKESDRKEADRILAVLLRGDTMKSKTKPEPLIPPDADQCQAEIPNGHSFMTLGGVPGYIRCTAVPIVIATEVKKDAHGRRGAMSLCGPCMNKMLAQLGTDRCTFKAIERS